MKVKHTKYSCSTVYAVLVHVCIWIQVKIIAVYQKILAGKFYIQILHTNISPNTMYTTCIYVLCIACFESDFAYLKNFTSMHRNSWHGVLAQKCLDVHVHAAGGGCWAKLVLWQCQCALFAHFPSQMATCKVYVGGGYTKIQKGMQSYTLLFSTSFHMKLDVQLGIYMYVR